MKANNGHLRFNGMSWDVSVIVRYRVATMIIVMAATVFFSIQIRNLKMTEDPLNPMYPPGHAFVPTLQAISRMAPEPRMLVVILNVNKGDIYNRATISKIDAITKGLMAIEGIPPNGITSLTKGFDHYDNTAEGLDIQPVLGRTWPETPQDFEALKRRVAVNPMGPGRYVSFDGTATMITAALENIDRKSERSYSELAVEKKAGVTLEQYKNEQSDTFNAHLLKSIHELKFKEDDANHTLYFMGPEVIRAQMTSMGTWHVSIAAAATFLLIVVLLALHFRTVQGVVVPLAAMILCVLWGLGMMGLTGIEFNPMALLFPLVLGLFSLSYSALALESCYRTYDTTHDTTRVIAAAYGNAPVEASILTAGLVGVSLCLASVPMIKDLGYFSVFWLIGTIVVVVFFTPILISLLPFSAERNLNGGVSQSAASLLSKPSAGRGRYVLMIVLLTLLALGVVCATKLAVGDNIPGSSYIRPNHPWNQCFNLFSKKFMGPYQLLVYVKARTQGGLLDPEAINAMGDFSDYLKDECGAKDSIAFDMMIKMSRVMLMDGNPKWQTVPVSKKQVERLAGLVMEQGGVESFMDKTFTEATISPFFPNHDAKSIDEYASKMQTYIETHPSDSLEFSLGGGLLGMTKPINDGTKDSYAKTLAAAFVAILVLGTLVTGSLLLGATITLPIAAAQAVVWIVMLFAGIPLSMSVVPAAVVSVGFGAMFGYYMIRHLVMSPGETVANATAVKNRGKSSYGGVLFLGGLVCVACLPWCFIGLKFQSTTVLMVGITVILQAIASVIFVPALVSFLTGALGFVPRPSLQNAT